TGFRWGRMITPVPRRMRVVSAATYARATAGSRKGVSGSEGEGGTRGEGSTTCSPVQTESSPAWSAARARPSIVSTFAASPKLMRRRRIFPGGLLHGPRSAASSPSARREALFPSDGDSGYISATTFSTTSEGPMKGAVYVGDAKSLSLEQLKPNPPGPRDVI